MRRERLIQFRVSEEEKARIGELAEAAGLPVSEFVRGRALEQVSGNRGGPPLGREPLDEVVGPSGRAPAPARASEAEIAARRRGTSRRVPLSETWAR